MPIRFATVRDAQSAEHLKATAMAEGDVSKALPMWREAYTLAPDSTILLGHLSLALLNANRHAEVIERLSAALPLHPRLVHLSNLLGVALFEKGHAREALRMFEHCLRLDPDYPATKGSIKNARKALKRAPPAAKSVREAIGRMEAAAKRVARPTLAVCMIVKDEAEFIVDALRSFEGVADELIVVDTGSTDATVALSEAEGATVSFFPWTGDFSEARNVSLEVATSDWIFVLDADERLTPASKTVVRAILEEYPLDTKHVVCPRIRNYTRARRYLNEGFSGRLFPNRPEMRFSGRVHEEVAKGDPEISTDYRLDLVLDHFGADPEVMAEKNKDGRNIELLQARLNEAPDDLMTWFYFASQHWIADRQDEALLAFERVTALFERNPSRYGMVVRNVPVPYSYVGLVRCLLNHGRVEEALAVGARGLGRFPDIPDLWYHVGFALIAADRLPEAREHLNRSRTVDVKGYALISMRDPTIQTWRAQRLVADIDFEQGDKALAYQGYRAVYDALPDDDDKVVAAARLVELASSERILDELPGLTLTYLALRPSAVDVALQVTRLLASEVGLQPAYDLLTTLYETVEPAREVVELSLVVGQIAEQAGEDQEALRWYERALALGHHAAPFWLNLAQLLIRLKQHEAAADAFAMAKRLMNTTP